ncbi:MAG: 50S ribosomal protein L10 [Fimbriimonadaceae bacterium]|nr:50S ribosomal protein L10 [Fimbriimonadaceae bacterium]
MPTAEKEQAVAAAKEWYSKSVGVVFTDFRGLKVKEMQQLRSQLQAKGGEIHVIKNTLFRLASGGDYENMPAELHNGPTAVAFLYENEAECAKVLVDYATSSKKLAVKGGYFAGKAFTTQEVESLSKLPPRDVLIAQLIGVIAAPLSNLVGVVEALYADPIRVIGAVADKVAEGSPVPEAKVEAPAVEEAPAAEEPAPEPVAEAAPTEEAAEAASEPAAEEASTTDSDSSSEAETAPAPAETAEAEGETEA